LLPRVTGLPMVHCHCHGHVARLCRHRARHCHRADHHQADRQGRRDAGRHQADRRDRQADRQGQRVVARQGHQRGARGQRRVVGRRVVGAYRRHHQGRQPVGQWCRRGDAMWRRQRAVAMRAKKKM
jgi:hypothetical protein